MQSCPTNAWQYHIGHLQQTAQPATPRRLKPGAVHGAAFDSADVPQLVVPIQACLNTPLPLGAPVNAKKVYSHGIELYS